MSVCCYYCVSIHARHYWRASPFAQRSKAGTLKVSIHARHYWRASLNARRAAERSTVVSIHARHYWRASPVMRARLPSRLLFQSTPAITGGRALLSATMRRPVFGFQSTPAITGGRAGLLRTNDPLLIEFQSTPAITGGRAVVRAWCPPPPPVFQSTPAITGGRADMAGGGARAAQRFNPRPPLLAGEPDGHAHRPHGSAGFNPRPPLLAGEPSGRYSMRQRSRVSIHARHYWRASPLLLCGRVRPVSCFNPRPPLLAGEPWEKAPGAGLAQFQSTPAITGGRARVARRRAEVSGCFNPRPPLLAGEPALFCRVLAHTVVSIHARHYWRASRRPGYCRPSGMLFQSTPAITGGRAVFGQLERFASRRFNPRPPLLAGEPMPDGATGRWFVVSIHARHYWRASPRALDALRQYRRFNPRPPLLAGEPILDAIRMTPAAMFQSTPAITGGRA